LISKLVAEAGIPIVTTSVNRSNEDYMTSLEDLDISIKAGIEFVLYEGRKEGRPSKLINLTDGIKMIER
jgi:tRNA A37 threonylcarbamoyladenosine synthetase subunit TsaC/SUA5/YrdC